MLFIPLGFGVLVAINLKKNKQFVTTVQLFFGPIAAIVFSFGTLVILQNTAGTTNAVNEATRFG